MNWDKLRWRCTKKIKRPKMIVWWPELYSSQMILFKDSIIKCKLLKSPCVNSRLVKIPTTTSSADNALKKNVKIFAPEKQNIICSMAYIATNLALHQVWRWLFIHMLHDIYHFFTDKICSGSFLSVFLFYFSPLDKTCSRITLIMIKQ